LTIKHVEDLESVMLLLDQQSVVAEFQEIHLFVAEETHANAAKRRAVNDADKLYRKK
jgi:hypothetical protein